MTAPPNRLRNDLVLAMQNPSVVLYTDEFVTIIADKYPKSKYHYLVLPKEDILDLRALKDYHIPKLVYMELKGLEYAQTMTGLPIKKFHVGFHSFPSMERLHLHVLSNDFRGTHMLQPNQWNSFHTEFFVPTHKAILDLSSMGYVSLPPNKKSLYQPLRCHMCIYFSNDIENLKLHLSLFHS